MKTNAEINALVAIEMGVGPPFDYCGNIEMAMTLVDELLNKKYRVIFENIYVSAARYGRRFTAQGPRAEAITKMFLQTRGVECGKAINEI